MQWLDVLNGSSFDLKARDATSPTVKPDLLLEVAHDDGTSAWAVRTDYPSRHYILYAWVGTNRLVSVAFPSELLPDLVSRSQGEFWAFTRNKRRTRNRMVSLDVLLSDRVCWVPPEYDGRRAVQRLLDSCSSPSTTTGQQDYQLRCPHDQVELQKVCPHDQRDGVFCNRCGKTVGANVEKYEV